MTHLALLLAQMDSQDLRMQEINEHLRWARFVAYLFAFVVYILIAVGKCKLFEKSGKPAWAAIVPVYNLIVLMEVIGRPVWWVLLLYVPFLGFIMAILVGVDVAKCFGKGDGFGLGLGLLPVIFYPLLAFSDAQYLGPISD